MGRRPATRDEIHKKRLQDAATYLKMAGWRSTNDFILDHYNTPTSASQSLRLQPQSMSYAPDDIMVAWLANVPKISLSGLPRLASASNAAWDGCDSV